MSDVTKLAQRRAEQRAAYSKGRCHAETYEHCPCLGALMRAHDWRYDQALHFAMGFRYSKQEMGDPFVIAHFGCCHPSAQEIDSLPA